ncbi:hypothetical protein HPB49_011333 [Dermacentor silvarum]|uniref:Uncharacterized protein n=1 Tax=Dermacentor silvarum TaxID=543639 RepID=A0ACB8DZX0_DERSI|nr:hypothetical protein HPB49_011333 [Dermacentor silvarum]
MGACVNRQRTLTHDLARVVATPVFATRHLTPSMSPPSIASTNHATSARPMPVSLHMVSKAMVAPDSQHTVRPLRIREWPYTVALKAGLITTACHVVHHIFTQTGHNKSFTHYRLTGCDAFPYSHEGCVANVCEPATFEQRHMWKWVLSDESVWDAFGCHARRALDYTDEAEQHLVRALDRHSVIALDELDYAKWSADDGEPDQVNLKKLQQTVFRRQLAVATRRRLPLVIHSRDATVDTIRILKEMVPADCLRLEQGEVVAGHFPAALPGHHAVAGFLGSRTAGPGRAPLDALLLEADATFFLPKRESKRLTCWHPGMVIHVATRLTT